MKKIFLYIGLIGLASAFSSCGKDFLETEPTEYVSGQQLKELAKIDPTIGESKLDGVYALMAQKGSGGTKLQTDYGQKGNDVISDFLSSDMNKPVPGYGWYNGFQQYTYTRNYKRNEIYSIWRFYYKIVLAANQMIDSFGDNPTFDTTTKEGLANKAILGQAYALRGYAYFYLVQFFAPKYEPNSEVVPLYKSIKDVNLPKAKQKDVYALITSDLEKAVNLLDGYKRKKKANINQNVARGLLAYTYATIGNYTKVKELTQAVIDSKEFTMMTPEEIVYNPTTGTGSGFNSVKIPGWMWGLDITKSMGLGLVSFWGQIDIFTYSYPSVAMVRSMSDQLYNLIRTDDVRRNQFSTFKGQKYVPFNKFFTPERKVQEQQIITTDYVYMRVAEMYLLKVEAEFFLGDENSAKDDLKEFLKGRIADTSYIDALSGDKLRDEIHTQWRIEFWGEGKSYLAMKRFKTPIVTGTNRFDTQNIGVTIQWDDPKLSFVIPENEIINNPNISK